MKKSTLKRMLELSDIKPLIKENKKNLSNFELVKESVNGKTYAIVKEQHRYYIKESNSKENLTESDFDYVGGVGNKAKKSFGSYSDATKHLNLMFEEINNHHEVGSVNILESDRLSEKKYVLKLKDKPKKEKPSEDEFDFGGEIEGDDEFDFGGEIEGDDEFDFGDETEGDDEFDFGDETEGDDEFDFGDETEGDDSDLDFDDSEDEIKRIQSTTGTLGQQLRDVEDLSSDMQKWVVKSVLSALDLDNMDSSDKKDIISTIKKKSEKEEEPIETDEFDFEDESQEMEESYGDLREDDDEFDGMGDHEWDVDDVDIRDVDMPIKDKAYLNLDPNLINPNERGFNENEDDDITVNGRSVARPDEVGSDMLLLDIDKEGMAPEEIDALTNININKRSRADLNLARRMADKDISKHYNKRSAPGYETKPVEKWAKHKLPYDMEFMDENYDLKEDHLNDNMNSYEQEKSYEEVESFVRQYGMDLTLNSVNNDFVYLNVVEGNNKILVVKVDLDGNIEVGDMLGSNFDGEPIDNVGDLGDILGQDFTNENLNNMDDITMMPNPQKAPEKDPSKPTTKPGKPGKTPDRERPSRRPFTPPKEIDPNDPDALPGPKAGDDDLDVEFE
jgi:hypothetical protein